MQQNCIVCRKNDAVERQVLVVVKLFLEPSKYM